MGCMQVDACTGEGLTLELIWPLMFSGLLLEHKAMATAGTNLQKELGLVCGCMANVPQLGLPGTCV